MVKEYEETRKMYGRFADRHPADKIDVRVKREYEKSGENMR